MVAVDIIPVVAAIASQAVADTSPVAVAGTSLRLRVAEGASRVAVIFRRRLVAAEVTVEATRVAAIFRLPADADSQPLAADIPAAIMEAADTTAVAAITAADTTGVAIMEVA